MPTKENMKMLEEVYDLVLEMNHENPNDSLRIAGTIVARYSWKRIKYALEQKWDLYDLDRWEAVADFYGRDPITLRDRFRNYDIKYSHKEFVHIMKNGDLFLKQLVDPLYEQGVEIMELTYPSEGIETETL